MSNLSEAESSHIPPYTRFETKTAAASATSSERPIFKAFRPYVVQGFFGRLYHKIKIGLKTPFLAH